MFGRLYRTKTFWAAVTAVVGAVGSVMQGLIGWGEALSLIVPAVMALFVRDGVAKNGGA